RHDPVHGDAGQRDAILRPPPPEATSVREDHATAIVMDSSEHPGMHARSTAAGDHVAANQTIQKMILLHYCSPFPGSSRDCFLLILARSPPSHWGATPRQPDAPGVIRQTGQEVAEGHPTSAFTCLHTARPVFNPRRGVAKPKHQTTS